MRQSFLFTKTKKEGMRDETFKNAILLSRAGYIDKLSAGVYSFLPLGLMVMKKIESVIREEMSAIGGQEVLMPALQPKDNWEKTGRWSTLDVLYKVADASKHEMALGPTHEEVVTPLAQKYILSYKDLPIYVYQFQDKFRMEARAKAGLLRGREFVMKDLYSFHASKADLDEYYEKAASAYRNIYERCGIGHKTHYTYASGGSFSKYSHEFQTETEAGEDTIYLCRKCDSAVNKEIRSEFPVCMSCGGEQEEVKSIEVGNIFKLMTKYSAAFDLRVRMPDDSLADVLMGCYGLGLSRLMGTVVEVLSDEKGLVWPEEIAPFQVHLVEIKGEKSTKAAEELYTDLNKMGVSVLYDDRDATAGEKLNDADLLGVPIRVVVSDKTVAQDKYEVKIRATGKVELSNKSELEAIVAH